jgi:membrane protease subunit (stomatin/prohibitin family)
MIVSRLTDLLGENMKSIFDLPKIYDELAAGSKARLKDDFEKNGVELVDFFINAITPPEEVQKMMDQRSGLSAMGPAMGTYMQMKTADAMVEAAKNPGGGAGQAMGLGTGLGMGMMMPQMVQQTMAGAQQQQQQPGRPAGPVPVPMVACPKCQTAMAAGSKFCPSCGAPAAVAPTGQACPACKAEVAPGARFCPNCGAKIGPAACPKCNTPLPPGSKFCPNCGNPS